MNTDKKPENKVTTNGNDERHDRTQITMIEKITTIKNSVTATTNDKKLTTTG